MKTNDESAEANGFMLQLQFQRMVVGNGCAIDKSGTTTLCGNKIKKYQSGGDHVEGRALIKMKRLLDYRACEFKY